VLSQKFFDSELLQQSIELAESLDKFHFFMNENHLDRAKTEIDKLAETHLRPFIFKNMYWLEVKRGNGEGQVNAARKLVDVEPSLENQYLLAQALFNSENDREALSVFNHLLDQIQEPTWLLFSIYKSIGNIYLKAKDFEAAEEAYNKAYTINSEDLTLLMSYGYLYLYSGRMSESKDRFAWILAKDKDYSEAYIGLAILHATVGEFELACANLSHVLDKNAAHKLALYLHYNWSDKNATNAASLDFINNFLKECPRDEEALTLKVGWYIKHQNFKKAYENLPILKKHYTGSARHMSQLEGYLRDAI
jgi:tetratricopeptide (TPR) repeat protein